VDSSKQVGGPDHLKIESTNLNPTISQPAMHTDKAPSAKVGWALYVTTS
jgi:hypothetical protein